MKEIVTQKDLCEFMKKSGMSFADLASELGVSEGTVRRLSTEDDLPLPKHYRLALAEICRRETTKKQ